MDTLVYIFEHVNSAISDLLPVQANACELSKPVHRFVYIHRDVTLNFSMRLRRLFCLLQGKTDVVLSSDGRLLSRIDSKDDLI